MKKVISCMLLISSVIYGQDKDKDNYFSISFGADIKNALVGSKPTNDQRALNWTIAGHAVSDNVDFCLGYERFDVLEYDRKFVSLGEHYEICYIAGTDIKFSIQPSIEMSWIGRKWNSEYGAEERTFFTPSLNVNWNWDLTKHFAIQINTNWLPRPDIRTIYNQQNNKYVLSEGISGVYKF